MEYHFRVKTEDTLRRQLELFWPVYFSSKFNKIVYLVWALLSTALIYELIKLTYTTLKSNGGHVGIAMVMAWVLALTDLAVMFLIGQIIPRMKMRRHTKIFGKGKRYSETILYDDHFCFHSAISDAQDIVPYADICSIRQTKHYFLIFTLNKMVYSCEKAGFENDNAEEAYQFLCSKIRT